MPNKIHRVLKEMPHQSPQKFPFWHGAEIFCSYSCHSFACWQWQCTEAITAGCWVDFKVKDLCQFSPLHWLPSSRSPEFDHRKDKRGNFPVIGTTSNVLIEPSLAGLLESHKGRTRKSWMKKEHSHHHSLKLSTVRVYVSVTHSDWKASSLFFDSLITKMQTVLFSFAKEVMFSPVSVGLW